ncbi:MAG: hypothetical protein PHF29_03605 [Candidatus Riflebacteria bacterium]|nr:hypothetical protein [Candidatus Riflebacteria bacterium]MDD3000817.1 hypothetical protein [Candidatus Riflebacteria bacterium]
MLSLIFTTIVFALISIFLPGFQVKGSKLNLVWLALGYLILLALSNLILLPVTGILGFLLKIISIIPIIGPAIAGAGQLVAAFVLTFGLTLILLIILDAVMDSFEMRSKWVALLASLILSVVRVIFLI